MFVGNTEITINGRLLKTARLRHEWCEFLHNPSITIAKIQKELPDINLFTFITEPYGDETIHPFYRESAPAAVLSIDTYDNWWNRLGFKVRNKIRKAIKSGVELRSVSPDTEFVAAVQNIYDESPVRQGRRFSHYGEGFDDIRRELSSFSDRASFVGAYHRSELIGFAKLFYGENILRTVHIIAKLSHRDKPVMDLLISKAVEICDRRGIKHFQYGSWSRGGLGDFKVKHGFKRVDVPRYFVPFNFAGRLMLKFNLHRPLRDRLPERWVDWILVLRQHWCALWFPSTRPPSKN